MARTSRPHADTVPIRSGLVGKVCGHSNEPTEGAGGGLRSEGDDPVGPVIEPVMGFIGLAAALVGHALFGAQRLGFGHRHRPRLGRRHRPPQPPDRRGRGARGQPALLPPHAPECRSRVPVQRRRDPVRGDGPAVSGSGDDRDDGERDHDLCQLAVGTSGGMLLEMVPSVGSGNTDGARYSRRH